MQRLMMVALVCGLVACGSTEPSRPYAGYWSLLFEGTNLQQYSFRGRVTVDTLRCNLYLANDLVQDGTLPVAYAANVPGTTTCTPPAGALVDTFSISADWQNPNQVAVRLSSTNYGNALLVGTGDAARVTGTGAMWLYSIARGDFVWFDGTFRLHRP